MAKPFKFWHDLLPNVTKRKKIKFREELNEKRVGIDMHAWMYDSPDNFAEFTHAIALQATYYEPTRLMKNILQRHERIVQNGVTPVYVFGGTRNPQAADKRIQREAREKYCTDFHRQAQGTLPITMAHERAFRAHIFKSLHAAEPKLTRFLGQWLRTELGDDATVVCAPFEPYWQLIELERRQLIDAIWSQHMACIMGGGKTIVAHSMMSETLTAHRYRAHIDWPRGKFGKGRWNYLPELAALYGTDYNQRASGRHTINNITNKVWPRWVGRLQARNEKELAAVIERQRRMTQKDKENPKWTMEKDVDFDKLQLVANQFRYGPVIRPSREDNPTTAMEASEDKPATAPEPGENLPATAPESTEDTAPTALESRGETTPTAPEPPRQDKPKMVLEPLNPLPPGVQWSEAIGFDPAAHLPITPEEYDDAYHFNGNASFVNENDTDSIDPWYVGLFPMKRPSVAEEEAANNIPGAGPSVQRLFIVTTPPARTSRETMKEIQDDREPILGW